MSMIKTFLSLATGLTLAVIGMILLWVSSWATEAGAVPVLAGSGMLLMAIPFISMIRAHVARLGRWLPIGLAAVGLTMVGLTTAALIALGVGENQRMAAHPGAAPGVIALIRPAAALGVAEAEQHLGVAYLFGQDEPKDLVLARYWTKKAAERGNPGAQVDLARMYARGLGGPVDGRLALAWAEKAADRGSARAYGIIGNLYLPGGPLPEDSQKANAAFAQGSERGDRESMFNLGVAYEYGTGVAIEPRRAFELYLAAAELGLPEAMLNVGVAYMNGRGVSADDRKARQWLEASKGDASAEVRSIADENLAIFYNRQSR
jgi:TPR repeat protein